MSFKGDGEVVQEFTGAARIKSEGNGIYVQTKTALKAKKHMLSLTGLNDYR
jgi:hypothetical protein